MLQVFHGISKNTSDDIQDTTNSDGVAETRDDATDLNVIFASVFFFFLIIVFGRWCVLLQLHCDSFYKCIYFV